MGGWRPIATAPLDELVLVWCAGERRLAVCEGNSLGERFWTAEADGAWLLPTLWAPIPPPP